MRGISTIDRKMGMVCRILYSLEGCLHGRGPPGTDAAGCLEALEAMGRLPEVRQAVEARLSLDLRPGRVRGRGHPHPPEWVLQSGLAGGSLFPASGF